MSIEFIIPLVLGKSPAAYGISFSINSTAALYIGILGAHFGGAGGSGCADGNVPCGHCGAADRALGASTGGAAL